ncbi:MAG: DUF3007 family protein [Gloeomargarita sp. SKYB31]|nr:DUF3007 family protein [Gloeomargarita sp. SKYB31]
MRRIDVLLIGLALLGAGGGLYGLLRVLGLDSLAAGVWTQGILIGSLILWVSTYAVRVVRKDMTYHRQRERYDRAWLEHQIAQLSPEELARLQQEIESQD